VYSSSIGKIWVKIRRSRGSSVERAVTTALSLQLFHQMEHHLRVR
jgi:hypothetical protein